MIVTDSLCLFSLQAIRIESLQHDYTNQESKKKENRDLNRYRDVTPCKFNPSLIMTCY